MKIYDAHCDLLDKMLEHREVDFKQDSIYADVSYPRLHKAGVALQCFAVFLSDRQGATFRRVLDAIDAFYERIAVHNGVNVIKNSADLLRNDQEGKLGAVLTLEGADGLEGSMTHLRIAFQLGVRVLGLTWNHANWAADGVMEPRKGGFTLKGRQLVRECSRLGMILDVSHLSEAGFWELTELELRPFIASHSNSQTICPHPRNLTDDQVKAIIVSGGIMGITFVPWFVKASQPTVKDILLHIDHICGLGGARHIGFGSDFDGIDHHIPGLANPGQYDQLANEILKRYSSQIAEGVMYGNWHRYFTEHLPR